MFWCLKKGWYNLKHWLEFLVAWRKSGTLYLAGKGSLTFMFGYEPNYARVEFMKPDLCLPDVRRHHGHHHAGCHHDKPDEISHQVVRCGNRYGLKIDWEIRTARKVRWQVGRSLY